ncbi:MAG: CoA transferase [Lautropia sp.]|nr:CoA transferase [Lautropia sp.]
MPKTTNPDHSPAPSAPLAGVRILSLALNLAGPAGLMRLARMGARCTKLEAPAPAGLDTSDPMAHYNPQAYADMHADIRCLTVDLKSSEGQARLHELLPDTDVLLSAFRPAALKKLGLDRESLQARYPRLCIVQVAGAGRERADQGGHDLLYQAEAGLLSGLQMPTSLLAAMGCSILIPEAVLQVLMSRQQDGLGHFAEVSLLEAAQWLALPCHWQMAMPDSDLGGAHAAYRVYACADGRVAIAALEPHFVDRLWQVVQTRKTDTRQDDAEPAGTRSPEAAAVSRATENRPAPDMRAADTHSAISHFFAIHTRAELDALARAHDIPLVTMP